MKWANLEKRKKLAIKIPHSISKNVLNFLIKLDIEMSPYLYSKQNLPVLTQFTKKKLLKIAFFVVL